MIIFSSHLFHPTGAAPLRHFYTITHTHTYVVVFSSVL